MNLILQMPMEVRLAIIVALGTCLGALINLLSYRLAWNPADISPWGKLHAKASPRRLTDRIPVLGWLGLRRESELHGRGFWIVPMLVELLVGVALAALYWWEIGRLGLLPLDALRNLISVDMVAMLHWPYLAHAILVCMMLTVSLIDIREKTIPDGITVPGVWIGLGLAILVPKSLPSAMTEGFLPWVWSRITPEMFLRMNIVSPHPWPEVLHGGTQLMPLLIGLACWWLWCVALMPRVWYPRWGIATALKLFFGKLRRDRSTYWILLMGAVGSAVIGCVWHLDQANWESLLSSLLGMAVGGGIIWTVRIIGGVVLDREAMGFGDVTLMAMIGAFLGWQACLFIFFLAPLAALVVGLVQLILFRDQEIPYGPFLCMATVAVIVRWPLIWDYTFPFFDIGWLVPSAMGFCMVTLVILLGISRLIRGLFGW